MQKSTFYVQNINRVLENLLAIREKSHVFAKSSTKYT